MAVRPSTPSTTTTATPTTTASGAAAPGEELGTGWLFFIGAVLGLAGFMRIVDAIWAFGYNGQLPSALEGGVLGSNLTTYGWVWLGVGVLLILSSFLILLRSQF